jgi:hypothetical protein
LNNNLNNTNRVAFTPVTRLAKLGLNLQALSQKLDALDLSAATIAVPASAVRR